MSSRHTEVTAAVDPHGVDGPCEEDCGVRDVFDRLGDKWSVLVLVELSKGTRRFRELERSMPGISPRMLTVTTKRLVRDGVVERIAHPTVPPQVDYLLTPLGEGLAQAVKALAAWSRDHREEMNEARRRYDLDEQ